ncbi:MAG: MATE family efflux transporter [Bacillota bacterium]
MTAMRQTASLEHEKELTVQQARKDVINLAWPSVVEQLLIQLFNMVDMMMVGGVGAAAIAAIGLTMQPLFVAMAGFMALNVGTTAVVARFIGAGDRDEANTTARQSLVVIGVMSIVAATLLYVFARPIVLFMGAKPDSVGYAVTYLRVMSLSFLPQTVSMNITAVLRGAGDTRTPMRYNIIANVVNVVGNAILINGLFGFPRWEVFGAAVATAISRVVGMILALRAVTGGKSVLHISFREKLCPPL